MSNVLSKDKREQVIALGRLGWSLRRIEAAVHIRRETIGGYLRAAGIPVRRPGGWGRRSPANPANEVITDSGAESVGITVPEPQPSRSRSASICEQYRELIEVGLSRGRNAKAIWQDLVDSHGFAVGYQSVQRFVGKLRRAAEPEARAVIQTAPGEAQVDYGSGPMVRDPDTGKYRRTRLFVLTLGYSRKCVRLLVFRSTARVWAELHEKAFRRWVGPLVSWCSIICAKVCSRPIFTILRSILYIGIYSSTMVWSHCLVAYEIQIARAKSNRASATRRRHR